jgi:hypothetical protein
LVAEAFEKLIVLFLIIASGYTLKKLKVFSESDASNLVKINTYTFLPALIFHVIYTSDFRQEDALLPLFGMLIMLMMTVLSLLFGRFILKVREKRFLMPFVVASSAGNTGYIGYPVCLALYGIRGLKLAVAYDIFATVFYALIIAAGLISYGAGKAESIKNLVFSVLKFPPTIAAILAMLLKSFTLPGVMLDTLEFASQAAIPLTLLALGISLVDMINFDYLRFAISVIILKLAVAPLLGGLLAPWMLEGLARKVAIIQTGMPSLMLTYILSVRYRTEPEFASFLVFTSTLTSIVTIPVIVSLIS